MIYLACGILLMIIGAMWLIVPAKTPNRLYGYLSYLAQVSKASFKFAQKNAGLCYLLFGFIQFILGIVIHILNWDRFFILWLLTFYFFILWPIILTEKSLKKFLLKNKELPPDYIEPDRIKHHRTKGFKDQ